MLPGRISSRANGFIFGRFSWSCCQTPVVKLVLDRTALEPRIPLLPELHSQSTGASRQSDGGRGAVACSLEMKPLVDLTSKALARMIEGKSPEEIRTTFNLPDDLTEEEKLEPLKSGLADARIKLLNKLYAKKRQVRECAVAPG